VLSKMLTSPVAESLVRVDFKDLTIEEGATENLERLNSMVEVNREKHVQRYGRKSRRSYVNRFKIP